ncbi:MAG: hypothetical protein ACLR3C_14270 [Eggerthella lenta]
MASAGSLYVASVGGHPRCVTMQVLCLCTYSMGLHRDDVAGTFAKWSSGR